MQQTKQGNITLSCPISSYVLVSTFPSKSLLPVQFDLPHFHPTFSRVYNVPNLTKKRAHWTNPSPPSTATNNCVKRIFSLEEDTNF